MKKQYFLVLMLIFCFQAEASYTDDDILSIIPSLQPSKSLIEKTRIEEQVDAILSTPLSFTEQTCLETALIAKNQNVDFIEATFLYQEALDKRKIFEVEKISEEKGISLKRAEKIYRKIQEENEVNFTYRDIVRYTENFPTVPVRQVWRSLVYKTVKNDENAHYSLLLTPFFSAPDEDISLSYASGQTGLLKILYPNDGVIDGLISTFFKHREEALYFCDFTSAHKIASAHINGLF